MLVFQRQQAAEVTHHGALTHVPLWDTGSCATAGLVTTSAPGANPLSELGNATEGV